jgi:hypothetical protein
VPHCATDDHDGVVDGALGLVVELLATTAQENGRRVRLGKVRSECHR